MVIEVLGNQARTEILHRLRQESRSASALAAELDLSRSSVHRHLLALEEQGYVIADVSPEDRSHRQSTAHWSINAPAIEAAIKTWLEYAAGTAPD